MANSHRAHFFHLVWSTKGRRNLILPKMKEPLYKYMGGIIRNSKGNLLEAGGVANHVHLLVEVSLLDHYTSMIRNLKANSSSWLKREFPECFDFAWQDGIGSFSTAPSILEAQRSYILNQEKHHQKVTFETEYIKLLELHGVKYDPRHVFD
jgi:putative transposase